jgi:hypothetical protein
MPKEIFMRTTPFIIDNNQNDVFEDDGEYEWMLEYMSITMNRCKTEFDYMDEVIDDTDMMILKFQLDNVYKRKKRIYKNKNVLY